jgi:hypothetical protein
MALDTAENEDFCLQCGYRQPHRPGARDVREARDLYDSKVPGKVGRPKLRALPLAEELQVGQALG